ncbi:MAG: TIR domain-containing protein [Candidatus Saganbacteria bacterium]|nr:TIR domain-containing protein [Candidatus Saganbacteria bacterium]
MATKRQVFYSFYYKRDCWRASTVRSIGAIEGNKPAPDNDWETIASGGDDEIKKWIKEQMEYRSCTIVLVGTNTANRKWINHEIVQSWNASMGVVGIYIHGLKNQDGYISEQGENPFDYIAYGNSGKKLSAIVKCYNPSGNDSKERYDWISKYISDAVEEAINVRKKN